MWKKNDAFSNPDLARMLSSPEAQALAQMLGQMDPAALNQAAALASQGDALGAKRILSPFLEDPKVKKLLGTMEDSHG